MKTVTSYHGVDQKAVEQGGSVWMNVKRKKRKRVKNDDAGDIEGWKGPWAKYKDEKSMEETNPAGEVREELDDILGNEIESPANHKIFRQNPKAATKSQQIKTE